MLVKRRRLDLLKEIWRGQKTHVEEYIQGVMLASIMGMIFGMVTSSRRFGWVFPVSMLMFVAGAAVLEELDHIKGRGEHENDIQE